MTAISPFRLDISQDRLDELEARLANTRWPEQETVSDWEQGAPLASVQRLCEYWRNDYDWRRCERHLNELGQYTTEIDGLKIHFLHIRSHHENALPMIMTHGWPGSIIEFMQVIGPLTDPVGHGGEAADAFHLVIPSLPGFGFSEKPHATGWGVNRIAIAWVELMQRLGYEKFVAQGGDWGAAVTSAIGKLRPPQCKAIHLNMALIQPTAEDLENLTSAEQSALGAMQYYQDRDSGYARIQSTRPQSIGYGLVDSPAAQAAWIYEKFYQWTDNNGIPEDTLSLDQMLDNIMLYWLPATGASSARLYWESLDGIFIDKVDIPVGISLYPKEIFRPSRRWAERIYTHLIHWNELNQGGHFAAFEQPELFTKELRECFRALR